MKQRWISWILATAMVFQLFAPAVPAAHASESTQALVPPGDGGTISWSIQDDVLTISGEGAMPDYQYYSDTPWSEESFTEIVVEEGITHVGNAAFSGSNAVKASMPTTLDSIGSYAFNYCFTLKEISLPSVLVIGNSAFYGTDLQEITFPGNLKSIDSYAFYGSNLTSITFSEGLQYIGEAAFGVCFGLEEITLPGSLTYIEDYAFTSCGNLAKITVPATVTGIKGEALLTGNPNLEIHGYPGSEAEIWATKYNVTFVELSDEPLPTAPDAPTGFSAEESKAGIQLSWDAAVSETLTGYSLRRSTDDVNYEEIAALEPGATSWLDTDTVSGMAYYYRLYPLWSEGEGEFAQVSCSFGDYTAPEAPVVTVSPEVAGGSRMPVITVSAMDNLSIDHVALFWSTEDIPTAELEVLVSEDKAPSFTDSWEWEVYELESGTYCIEAIACDAAGNYSEATTVSFTVDNTAPPVPTGITADATTGYIHVMWDTEYQVPEDFARFEVYRSDSPEGDFALVSSGTGAGFYDQSDSIDSETTYYYYVVAVDKLGNASEATDTVSAQLLTDTSVPVIVDMLPASNATVCKEATLQVSATDDYRLSKAVFYYLDGETWVTIGTAEAQGITNNTIFSCDWILPEDLGDTVTIKAEVYDTAGNAPAVWTRILNVLAYQLPAAPQPVVQSGFQRATISWSYDATLLRTLSQFKIYRTDASGEARSLVATVARSASSSYTLPIEKNTAEYYVVEAVDCFGATACSDVLEIISAPDTTAPTAVLRATASLAAIGQEVVFSAELSGDNDGIGSYEWDIDGDGITDATGARISHCFDAAGTYTVTLTVRDLSGNESTARTAVEVCDPEIENGEYTQIWITAVNAYDEDLTPVSGAEVTVRIDSENFETVGFTDETGLVVLTIPRVDCTVYVAAEGFASTTRAVVVDPRNRTGVTVGLMPLDVSVVSGELTVREMTYDEIIDAGIDTEAPGNEHVFTFQTELTFVAAPGMKGMTITPISLVNAKGQLLSSANNWLDIDISGDGNNADEGGTSIEGAPDVSTSDTTRVGFFPLSEHFVLVVYGQTHWLKEMFHVELMVINNNHLEPITDCVATLNLPNGLSLAEMVEGVQTESIVIGEIGCNGSDEGNTAKAIWYVRGDMEGSYGLTASVTGMIGQTPFVNTFSSEDMIQVYAGSALELTVYADNHTFQDVDYHMTYKLENVSDKTLYNVSLQLDKTELSQNFTCINLSTGQLGVNSMVIQTKDLPADGSITFKEVKPGEAIYLDLYCQPLFLSLSQLVDIGPLEMAYYLCKMVTVASDGNTTSVPCKPEYVTVTHGSVQEETKDEIGGEVKDTAVDITTDMTDLGDTSSIENAVKIYKFFTETGDRMNSTPTLTIRLDSADGEFIPMPGEVALMSLARETEETPLRVYTDSEDFEVEHFDGYSLMTITGDAKVYVVGENPGDAELTMTTWAQSYEYNEETNTMDIVMRDITYTASYHIQRSEPDPEPIRIVAQPQNAEAVLGETYCVTVVAEGEGLKYQWYFRNAGDEKWTKSSVRDNTYDDVLTKARVNREVYCVITDQYGNSVETSIAKLIRVPAEELKILTQPTDAKAVLGENFCVTVIAQGEGLKYQWYFRNTGDEKWTKSGVKDNTYDDEMTKARAGREVYCVITDALGNTVTTNIAKLIRVPSAELKILTQPTNAEAALGENFCVTVIAQGEGLKYQWYFRNAGDEKWTKSGVKDNTYDDEMTKARAGREVYCVITDALGNTVTTNIAKLIRVPAEELKIIQQPTNAEAALGENFCVTVIAQGEGLKYQWYFRNAGTDKWTKSGVKDNTYDDVMTKARAGREVYCVITDALGNTVTTDIVTLVQTG